MPMTDEQKVALLRGVELLAGVSEHSMAAIAQRTGELTFAPGQRIVSQGQLGNGLYLIASGAARVQRGDEVLARLGPGEVFGELAVIDQMPRSASVVAEEPTTCLALASWDFLELVESDPKLALGVLRVLASRLRAAGERHHH
ncbi:MAG TPA: cyclic nucleotide-binding domain-containing protein [Candidatus Limnocylindrales bacterium]|nr:cyclic nucleotide-binding domain-containing protein [Candidatus Limnocylindrales bacterium]